MSDYKKKFLLIRFSSIGDIVQSTSVISTIIKYYPNSIIDFVTLSRFSSIFKNHKHINSVFSISSKESLKNIYQIAKEIRNNDYSYIIDLHRSTRSYLFKIAFEKSKIKTITKPRWNRFNLFLLHRNLFSKNFSVRSMFHDSISDILPKNYQIQRSKLYISSKEEKEIERFLKTKNKRIKDYFVLAPGSAWSQKEWFASRYVKIINKFYNKEKITPVLIGSLSDKICNKIEKSSKIDLINLCGKTTLRQSLSLLSKALFTLGSDTGMIHASEALERPTISILGPTSRETGASLFNSSSHIIKPSNLWCRPCSQNGSFPCYRKKQYCLSEVDENIVLNAMNQILIL